MQRRRLWGRGPALVALACVVVLVLLALRVHGQARPLAFDAQVDQAALARAHGHHLVPGLVADRYVGWIDLPKLVATVTLLVSVALLAGDAVLAVVAGLGPLATVELNDRVLKPLIDRHLPGYGAPSFPSGHTAAAASLVVVAVLIAWRRWGSRSLWLSLPVGTAVVAGMGASLLRLHDHVPSDILGGAATAGAVVVTVGAAVEFVAVRWVGLSARARPSSAPASGPGRRGRAGPGAVRPQP